MKTDCLIITALESELKKSALPKGVEIVYSGIGKINATIATIPFIELVFALVFGIIAFIVEVPLFELGLIVG